MDQLGLRKTNHILNLFLLQVELNFKRTINVDSAIKKAIFRCTAVLLANNFPQGVPAKKYQRLYTALMKGNYKQYYLICSMI